MRRASCFAAQLAFLCVACAPDQAPTPTVSPASFEPVLLFPNETPAPEVDARAAALTAVQTADLLSDLNEFLIDALGLGQPDVLARLGSSASFNAPASCTFSHSFRRGHVALERDCTLPSGRHLYGSLEINLGAACSPFGLSVEYEVLVESAPGAGDEVSLVGKTNFGFGNGKLHLATTVDHHLAFDQHTVDHAISGCFILDGRARIAAMNGFVSTAIDGNLVRQDVRIDDLQSVLCEALPYTGSVSFESNHHSVEAVFDRTTPTTARITVTVDGNVAEVELPVVGLARLCGATVPSTPLTIDYDACGGCGQPPAPFPPPGGGGSTPPPSQGPDL